MNPLNKLDTQSDELGESRLLDVLIRAGLILAMVGLCLVVFAPFMSLMIWALILAVTFYPLHQALAKRLGGRQGLSATIISLAGVVLIVGPTAVILNAVGDAIYQLVNDVQQNKLQIPPPRASVENWPIFGPKIHATWEKAHTDLPGLVMNMQPKLGDITRSAVTTVASMGVGLLKFIGAFVLAGLLMAFGHAGERSGRATFTRVAGMTRGAQFTRLCVSTIRAVAQGVVGVAFVQAVIIGICLFVAGVPGAGVLSGVVLVLAIAQIPALIVTVPAIIYLWTGSGHGHLEAAIYSALLFISGMVDNVLRPLMLGRGVDAPMPVILVGALGGMATAGILGMFVGATLMALGYQIFTGWVEIGPDETNPAPKSTPDSPAND